MKYSYRFSLVLLLSLLANYAMAQISGSLKGIIKDQQQEAVSFANVALLKFSDSTLISGAVTDIEGHFLLKTPQAGEYLLRLSAIGFTNQYTVPFVVSGPSFEKDFGTIILQEDVKVLGEVKVQAMRPTVVNEIDRMVVSVEGTAMASGSTAFEMLEKSPGIWIDQDGNIQLNGKGGVKVMIDGRTSYLSGKELQNLLEGMSAENIKEIELITNPSAKYDAEGSSGIINIRLKKNRLNGMNGSLDAGYKFNGAHGYNSSVNLNIKQGKWNSFMNASSSKYPTIRDAKMYREFNSEIGNFIFDQKGHELRERFNHSLRLGTDYQINDRHSIGIMGSYSISNTDFLFETLTDLENINTDELQRAESSNDIQNDNSNLTLNLHYTAELDTLGTSFTTDVNYVKLNNSTKTNFNNLYKDETDLVIGTNNFFTDGPNRFDIYSAQFDFTKQIFGQIKMETGAKASHVISDNALNFYTFEGNEMTLDFTRTDHFIFKENIFAGYVSLNKQLSKKWMIKAGVRAEQTLASGHSYSLNQTTERKYLDFFPTVFLKQTVSDKYQISYNYSRRIDRPQYDNLNPFIVYLDPYTSIKGNPYLRPEYTHSFQMTHTLLNKYNLVLGYSQTKDLINEVPIQNNEDQTTVFSSMNINKKDNISATLIAPVQISKHWEFSNTLLVAYQNNAIQLEDLNYSNEQIFFMAQSNHNFILPKGYRLQLNGTYRGPVAAGVYKIEGAWWVDVGIKKSFLNDKFDLSINGTDIFRTLQIVGSMNVEENINSFDQYFSAQSIKINLRYRFSRGEKFKSRNQNIKLDELNRAGG